MIKITSAVLQLIYNYRSNISWVILKFLNNFSFLVDLLIYFFLIFLKNNFFYEYSSKILK